MHPMAATVMPRRFPCLTMVVVSATCLAGCRSETTVQGTVRDFGSGEPIVGAEVTAVQHGWGFQDGSLVWDKDKSTTVRSGPGGAFEAPFRRGSSVRLRVRAPGYQRFEAVYAAGPEAGVRLKRRVEGAPVLPGGILRLGLREDGTMYGWDLSAGRVATSPEEADILPVEMGGGARDPITVRAPGGGGLRFVPGSELGVDGLFLVFSDRAPVDGYVETAVLDFESEGGIYFVRTREGRYAKLVFTPSGFGQTLDPGVRRDLSLQYVYNPDGSRDLFYQMPE